MTISEVATFPKSNVPLVNVLASKLAFRPVFYWRDLDVLLTTPKVIPLRASQNKVDIRGLLFLFTIFQVHRKSCITFDVEKLRTLPKTGWAEALKDGVHNYGDSVIKLGTPRCDFLHSSADYFTALDLAYPVLPLSTPSYVGLEVDCMSTERSELRIGLSY